MDLLTPCEEAFIWFVVLLDIIRYHSYSLEPSLEKYDILFSDQDKEAILDFIGTYTKHGVERSQPPPFSCRKPFKGYRTKDIHLFLIVKKQVLSERMNQKTVVSPDIDLPSGNLTTTGVIPFTFSFPESIACIKLEPYDSNKKRKLLQQGPASPTSPSMAMAFDDGDVFFDYTKVTDIPLQGV
jgi:hypothetical protein